MDKVQCKNCGKSSVPRLWSYQPFLSDIFIIPMRYVKTQHICPFCGVCMYETGGELNVVGKVLVYFFAIPLLIAISICDGHLMNLWAYLAYCLVAISIVWRLYQ